MTLRGLFARMHAAMLVHALACLACLLAACTGEVDGGGGRSGGSAVGTGGSNGQAGQASGAGMAIAGNAGNAGAAGGGSLETVCADAPAETGAGLMRRLTSLEYQLTLQDLFALQAPPNVEGIPPDATKDGFTTFAELQAVSAQHLRGYLEVASGLASELLADAARRTQVITCELEAADCLSAFVTRFGKLAYRRPLEADELSSIVDAATLNALDVEDRYRYAIEVLLVSPSFLYRVEAGEGGDDLFALGPYELAARLSFTLWGRAPSEELLEQAAAGALDTPAGFSEVALAMVDDARTERFLDAFFTQWLGFGTLRSPKEPASDWDDALLTDMGDETAAVLSDFAWGGRDFLDVLTTNSTKLSPALATYYGLPAPLADGVVEIPADHPRANTGLLTHAALISAKSDGDSIAKRGNWLRKTFLCRGLEVPPEVAETFGERLVGLTRVEIVQERNTDQACSGCHAMIDPIGVGFEAFDETGRYREGIDITPFGVMPGLPDAPDPAFTSIAELSTKLRGLPEVSACLTDRAFLYTSGREPAQADRCTVERAATTFADAGHDFRALLRALVEAPEFRLRKPPDAVP